VDATGGPVVSYQDATNGDLRIAHCNDANCAGGNESIATVDQPGNVGLYTSLELDSTGKPVIIYYDATNGDLKVAHCNDADCVGGDESLASVDQLGAVGFFTSLALDAAGNPVISLHDNTNLDLKVAHCNDGDCAGGDDRIVTVDTVGSGWERRWNWTVTATR
jgi:hypothetical protein